ncbi:MAG: alpha-galactosidase, partial [Fimbriimonas sp.]
QGGGAAATIEPLKVHIDDYERHLVNNLGYGVQSCYRGPRLYDSPEVKAMVIKQVSWFKKHRAILESDVIHLRRADARNWDGVLHVNPSLPEKAMLVAYNPRTEAITQRIQVPLHYSGLRGKATMSIGGAKGKSIKLDAQHQAEIEVTIPPQGMTWVLFR